MTLKLNGPLVRAAFLRALAQSANATLAAEAAGVSHSRVYTWRRRDADFARDWATALLTARVALAGAPLPRRDGVAARLDGKPLAMTGTSARGSLMMQRARDSAFDGDRKRDFLIHLGRTCNVRAAAAAARVRPTTAYQHRHEHAPFRAAWNAAVEEGRVNLEMALLGASLAMLNGADPEFGAGADVDIPALAPGMDAGVALQMLRLHTPGATRRTIGVRASDPETARASVLAKAAAIRAARARESEARNGR